MKTSEILISTFVAAAAMSVPAFAETTNTEIDLTGDTYAGKRINVNKSSGTYTFALDKGSSIGTYTPSETQTYTVNVGSTTQLFFNSGSFGDFPLDIILNGAGCYNPNNTNQNNEEVASLRLHNGVAISGNITLAGTEDARIWASAAATVSGKVSSYAGSTSGLTLASAHSSAAQNLLTLTGGMEIAGGLCVEAFSSTKYAQLKLSKADDAETAPVYSAASLSGAGSLTIDTGVTFTTWAITGFTGTLSGAGTLALSNTAAQDNVSMDLSAFTGTLSLAGNKRLSFKDTAALSAEMKIDVSSGNQLFLATDGNRLGNLSAGVTIAGNGYGTKSGEYGAIRLHNGSVLSGKLTLSADAMVYASGNTAGNSLSGGIDAAGKTLTLYSDGANDILVSGAEGVNIGTLKFHNAATSAKFSVAGTIGSLTGAGSFTKDGAGTLTISDRNSSLFTGSVLISGGTLLAGAEYALGMDSSVTIDGGQLQIGEGVMIAVDNISVVLSDAYLNPSVTMLAEVDVSSNAAILGTEGGDSESIGGSVTVTADLAALSSIFTSVGQYDFQIIDADTVNVTKSTLTLDSDLESAFDSQGWEWSFSNGVLTVNVPEPSSFGLLAGAGVLALAVARRRRPCRKS